MNRNWNSWYVLRKTIYFCRPKMDVSKIKPTTANTIESIVVWFERTIIIMMKKNQCFIIMIIILLRSEWGNKAEEKNITIVIKMNDRRWSPFGGSRGKNKYSEFLNVQLPLIKCLNFAQKHMKLNDFRSAKKETRIVSIECYGMHRTYQKLFTFRRDFTSQIEQYLP